MRNDSLHISLDMDLNDVHVGSLTAVSFTLVLQAAKREGVEVELPPVIITGSKRFRFERRERALASCNAAAIPYLVLIDNHKTVSKNIDYRISIPYASWMQKARLLLRQELKDCCDLQLLGVDTLEQQIALKGHPVPVLRFKPLQRFRFKHRHPSPQSQPPTPRAWSSISIIRSAKMISILI